MKHIFILVSLLILVTGCQPKMVTTPKEPAPPPAAAEVRIAREIGWPVAISDLSGTRGPSNDITVRFVLTNVSDRTIRNVYLTAYMRNEKGDPVLDGRTRSVYRELEFKGPLRPDQVVWGEKAEIPRAFRHNQAARIHVRDVRAVFEDGTETLAIRVEGHPLFRGPITDTVP